MKRPVIFLGICSLALVGCAAGPPKKSGPEMPSLTGPELVLEGGARLNYSYRKSMTDAVARDWAMQAWTLYCANDPAWRCAPDSLFMIGIGTAFWLDCGISVYGDKLRNVEPFDTRSSVAIVDCADGRLTLVEEGPGEEIFSLPPTYHPPPRPVLDSDVPVTVLRPEDVFPD
jgi:hypothetical protein